MSRPINEERPGELRNAIVHYLIKHGLNGLSLRPLAKALGCTPRVLLYHFGSKEKMVIEGDDLGRRMTVESRYGRIISKYGYREHEQDLGMINGAGNDFSFLILTEK